MAKLTAWLVTLIGLLLIAIKLAPQIKGEWFDWVIALAVLVIGIGKLVRNYKK